MDYAADWLSAQIDRATLGAPVLAHRDKEVQAGPFVRSFRERPAEAVGGDAGLFDVLFCAEWKTPFYRVFGADPARFAGLPAVASLDTGSVFLESTAVRKDTETRERLRAIAGGAPGGCLRVEPCDDAVRQLCCATDPGRSNAPWILSALVLGLVIAVAMLIILSFRTRVMARLAIKFRRRSVNPGA